MRENVKKLRIIEQDPWLEPSEGEIIYRHRLYQEKLKALAGDDGSIVDFANGYKYFGFQRDELAGGWWFREWLPGAYDVFLFGDFNDWQRTQLRLERDDDGVWSIFLPDEKYSQTLIHGSLVKMLVHGKNGWLERIPAYIRRAVQDDATKNFTGQLWLNQPFDWGDDNFDISKSGNLLIYEAHVGMGQEQEKVGTFTEFTDIILPKIKALGYNSVQLMAVAEHPYYGSFGYHVSNFYAVSSRFGTPEELKALIRKAHQMGIAVIMDLVHSHFVNNLNEGLNELDGTDTHYSLAGEAGIQPYWDSKNFDYTNNSVTHFLLSNVKFWLEEFHFDGFRFDGVTSMIYHHHGYTEFDAREKFFDDTVNRAALTYLTLANKLVHEVSPKAITIAEDVSGMPGMCIKIEDGGIGFNYRLGMAIPDFWIKMLKDLPDEQWDIWDIWNIMTNRLPDVQTIAYAESHDQALVGDKTLAFRLMDQYMYTDMDRSSQNYVVDRGMALHKMIRLATITMGGQAYLNFMGNEFGHPEWIDFPREGNNWSYEHAHRQWGLADNQLLRYSFLNAFDHDMIEFVKRHKILANQFPYRLSMDQPRKTMVYSHRDLVFVLNWHPTASMPDYVIPVREPGTYKIVLSTDDKIYGGFDRQKIDVEHFTYPVKFEDGHTEHHLKIYNTSRTAIVFQKMK